MGGRTIDFQQQQNIADCYCLCITEKVVFEDKTISTLLLSSCLIIISISAVGNKTFTTIRYILLLLVIWSQGLIRKIIQLKRHHQLAIPR